MLNHVAVVFNVYTDNQHWRQVLAAEVYFYILSDCLIAS